MLHNRKRIKFELQTIGLTGQPKKKEPVGVTWLPI